MKIDSGVIFSSVVGSLSGCAIYIALGGTNPIVFLFFPIFAFVSAAGTQILMGGKVVTFKPKVIVPLENPNRYTSEQIGYIRARRWQEPLNSDQLKELYSI